MTTHSQPFVTVAALAIVATLVAAAAVPLAAGAVASAESGSGAGAAPETTAISSAASEPTLVVADATVDPGGTATQRIALTDVPDGLAGFEVTLELESDVATVTGAAYPDHYGMTTDPIVSADGRTITVEAVDLNDEIAAGASDVTLATLELEGVEDGATELRVTDVQVDADGGDPVDPSLEVGTVTVGDSDSAAGSNGPDSQSSGPESESTGSADGDSESAADGGSTPAAIAESVPGFTGGVAIAAIAALAAAMIARRT